MSIRRLNKELKHYPKGDGPIQFKELVDDNVAEQRWTILPSVGETVAFDGVLIGLHVKIPGEYPFKAPKVTLDKTIFHPNVHQTAMCLDTVNNWHPKTTVLDVMKEVLSVIMSPTIDTALNTEAANLFMYDRQAYVLRARAD